MNKDDHPNYPVYQTNEAEALPSGLMLALLHGRDDAKQDIDGFGFAGPVIGPLRYVHTTYGTEVKVCLEGQDDADMILPVVEGCISYDGKYYGDWSVFLHVQRRQKDNPIQVERRNA